MFESEGAITTSTRPHGFSGRPLFALAVSSTHVFPPSVDRYIPLPLNASGPSPPERNVHPFLRKSQRPAMIVSGAFGSSVTPEQPVLRLAPLMISDQVLPPSLVL